MKKIHKIALTLLALNSSFSYASVHDGVASCKVDGRDILLTPVVVSPTQLTFEADLGADHKVAASIEPGRNMLYYGLSVVNGDKAVANATAWLPDPRTSRHDVFSRLSTLLLSTKADDKKIECEFRLQRALEYWQQ